MTSRAEGANEYRCRRYWISRMCLGGHHWPSFLLPLFFLSTLTGVLPQTCELPQALQNRNLTSNALGAVTTNDTSVVWEEGFRDCTKAICNSSLKTPITFNCQENQDDVYLFKSEGVPFSQSTTFYYMCWYISQQLSDDKWVYYQGPADADRFYDATYIVADTPPSTNEPTFDQVCNLTSPLPVSKYALLLDTDSLASQFSSCPDALLGTFNATQTTTSCVSEFDVCNTTTRQTILLSDPACRSDAFFSVDSEMDCLHSMSEDDVTYVTTFTPESDSVTFACMAYVVDGDSVYYHLQEFTCDGLQTPTTTSYDVFLEPTDLCPFPCIFPTGILGTWLDSRQGQEVTFNETALSDFYSCSNPTCSQTVDGLECYRTEDSNYLVRTPVTTVNSESVRVYICLELTELSSTKYLYYMLHKNLHETLNDYVVTFNPGQSVSLSQACENLSSDHYPATRQHILLQSGNEASSFSACPDELLGEFSNADDSCQSTYETCDDDTRLQITGTSCSPKPFFSAGGSVGCVYSVTVSDTTYVTLYNTDSTPDGNSTFAFTCVAFKVSGITLELSQNPLECDDFQTADSITTTDGALFVYEQTGTCDTPCSFPSALSGTWVDSRTAGEVTWASGVLTDFFSCSEDPPCSTDISSLQCYITDNTNYLLRSEILKVDGEAVRIYLCLELSELSTTKFLYYQRHEDVDSSLEDYVAQYPYNQSVTIAQACEDFGDDTYQGTRHHVLLKSGEEASSFSTCPDDLQGEFSNADIDCESTYDTCDDDTQLAVSGTDCSPKPFFSEGGSVGCLYSVTVSDTTFVTLYNTDSTPEGNTTFAFTCVALEMSGSELQLSQNPLQCVDGQTPTSITSDLGAVFVYEQTGKCSSEFDFLLIIIVLAILLVVIIVVALIIFLICRKKRKDKKRKDEEEGAILTKEQQGDDEERGSNLSIDSGYPRSRGDSRTGRVGGRGSRGTQRSHFAELFEEAEGEDPKQVNIIGPHGRRRRRRRRRGEVGPHGKNVEDQEESDPGADYSDDSWEEYVDEDGNSHVRPRPPRQRRRKKVKHKYTRTHVQSDGTTVDEEVESEYSVTASSDMTSSEEDRESLTDQIRAEKERRRTRLDKIMEGSGGMAAVIVTRDMDEKANQPEKQRPSLFQKLRMRARARDRDRKKKTKKTKVRQHPGMFPKDAGKAEVPGVTGAEREIPYLLQYQKKKEIEKTLNDDGFFDDPDEKMTAEKVFGFQSSDRILSPKYSDQHRMSSIREMDEERMNTATDSSQSEARPSSRDGRDGVGEASVEGSEEGNGGVSLVAAKDKNRHVTIEDTPSSPTPSSSSWDMTEDSSGRKSSDTSSGVADLSPSHHPSSPDQNHASFADGSGKDSRRVSLGWEKVHGLYAKHRLSVGPGARDLKGEGPEGRGTASKIGQGKSKQKMDKRVKTALRRLLTERLFGSSDKKKSRRSDDVIADSWTNADSVANNVSEVSSAVGTTRGNTRQTARPVTQGKVAFAELDSAHSDPRSHHHHHPHHGDDLSPARRFKEDDPTTLDLNAESSQQGRLPTRGGSRLPPLKTATMSLDRVFTPANYPKWGLFVTASQRNMLVDGLHRDRSVLSRLQARTAWSSKTEDGLTLPPGSRGTVKGEEMADDESYLDPHRPDTKEGEGEEGEAWAHRRAAPPGGLDENKAPVAYTKASGKSPLDIDDRRLRRLLEELYRDKKFMDKLINKIDQEHLDFPDHLAAEDVKFLSEFGRQYLLNRANFWELHGPLGHPRPPPTALGMRLACTETALTSDGLRHQNADESAAAVTSPRPKTVR